MLTSTAANTIALEDLKEIFMKFFANTNHSRDGSGSVSISALKTQGGIQAPSVELEDARCQGISQSSDQEIFSMFASEGEQPPKGPQTRSLEKVSKKGVVATGSVGSKKGATLIASGVPSMKPIAEDKDTSI
jgi:hypothetical protein